MRFVLLHYMSVPNGVLRRGLRERGRGPGRIRAEASSAVRCHGGFGGVVTRMGKLHGAGVECDARIFFFSGEEGGG